MGNALLTFPTLSAYRPWPARPVALLQSPGKAVPAFYFLFETFWDINAAIFWRLPITLYGFPFLCFIIPAYLCFRLGVVISFSKIF